MQCRIIILLSMLRTFFLIMPCTPSLVIETRSFVRTGIGFGRCSVIRRLLRRVYGTPGRDIAWTLVIAIACISSRISFIIQTPMK